MPARVLARSSPWIAALAILAAAQIAPATAQRPAVQQPAIEVHPEFEQLLPRGRIASIDEPVFVEAAEAEISDDAWIFGVKIDGQTRAYSLNLLNRHEVVNDQIGESRFAAVW